MPEPTTPESLRQAAFWRDFDRLRDRPITGGLTSVTPQGIQIRPRPQRPAFSSLSSSLAAHPFKVSLFKDGTTWKARVKTGTVNGTIPVVGLITTSGGTSLDTIPAPAITLTSTNNLIVLGIKVDLETDAILRLTVENREDSDVDPIEDLEARTRIFFETIAVLTYTPTPEAWAVTTQVRKNHLTYEWGTVYIASV